MRAPMTAFGLELAHARRLAHATKYTAPAVAARAKVAELRRRRAA